MKAKHLFVMLAALLAAGGVWFARAAWRAHRQLVTLDIPNATLAVVLRKIERQVWVKIRTEESLAGVHVKVHARDTPLPEVLDQLAAQAGARWNTLYAVYRNKHALRALDSSLQGDGKLDQAGWTKIAPNLAALAESRLGQTGPVTYLRGRRGQVEIWSPELLLESSLSNRLGNDSIPENIALTKAVAARTARKVGGRTATYLAFHKSSMGIGFRMRRGTDSERNRAASLPSASQTTSAVGTNDPPATGRTHRPPNPIRQFQDFTPEQRVKLARQGHGPGG